MDIRFERMRMYDLRPLIPTVGFSFGGHLHWHGELTVFILWLKWGYELRLRSATAPAPDETVMHLFDQFIKERAGKMVSSPAPERFS